MSLFLVLYFDLWHGVLICEISTVGPLPFSRLFRQASGYWEPFLHIIPWSSRKVKLLFTQKDVYLMTIWSCFFDTSEPKSFLVIAEHKYIWMKYFRAKFHHSHDQFLCQIYKVMSRLLKYLLVVINWYMDSFSVHIYQGKVLRFL